MNKNYVLFLKLCSLFLAMVLCSQFIGFRSAQANIQSRPIDFAREIRPILSDKCFACHGPDATAKNIKLRLDSEAGAMAAIVAGDPTQSKLIKRITHKDEALRMPPVDSGRSLTSQEIELLKEWIRQGAKWQSHWAFVAPVRPALPQIKNTAWPKNAIDYFVLARLEKDGLEPSPEADKSTLLRRVSFDLTGLPPTLQDLDDFLTDTSPDAYEKVVDRLLASPRYGERMAYKWLDAARYADTNGYQVDGNREAWRWRDWVIESFNANKPFDQFTIEQLAGDLLPPKETNEATSDQRIATAFNRNHRINAEGGVVPEEYRIEYVVDRVDTTSTVFMGLTLGCARCHNHKYDPFTQKEFYQLSAYFNNIDEDGHSFDQGNSPPVMLAPTREQQQRLQQFEQDIATAQTHYDTELQKASEAMQRWEKKLIGKPNQQWFPEEKLIVQLTLDENSKPVFNKSERAYHDQYNKPKDEKPINFEAGWREGAPRFISAPTGQGVAFDGKSYFDGGIHADFRYKTTSGDYKERFTIASWIKPESNTSQSIITKISDNPAEKENGVPRADGYGLYLVNGKLHFNMIFRWGEDALRVETVEPLKLNEWQHVAVVFDGMKQWEDRLQIYINGVAQKLKFNQRNFFLLFGGTKNTLKIGAGGGPEFRFKGALDEVRMYSRALQFDEIQLLANTDSLEKIAALPASQRTQTQTEKITRAFVALASPASLQQAYKKLWSLREQEQIYTDSLPTLMVMAEMAQPRPAYLLRRGAYDAPGEQVTRAVPASLPAMPAKYPNNRLGFAQWLTSPEHPLTARVTVNRFWQNFFGVGLVKTTEDFGSQGELPSHPELLDWLACEFMKSERGTMNEKKEDDSSLHHSSLIVHRWDIKALLKTIVMSATYRQSAKRQPTTDHRPPTTDDPDNRLYSRGPRYRLSAEMIRDQALFVSGLLVEKLGGPSVKPYQPAGLYKDMAFGGQTGYDQSKGDGLWRRSLYTYWKRTILAPNMQAFDATAREFCNVRDVRTNTPLQSLNLMNDVTYIEAARMLAERMLKEGGATAEQRIAWAFRVVTSRQPNDKEGQVLTRHLNKQLDAFKRDKEAVKKLLSVGEKRNDDKLDKAELAAYATTASLILNLDEVITKQ